MDTPGGGMPSNPNQDPGAKNPNQNPNQNPNDKFDPDIDPEGISKDQSGESLVDQISSLTKFNSFNNTADPNCKLIINN
jgi:hypothetical protein